MIKVRIKAIFIATIISMLMYPDTASYLINSVKDIYTFGKIAIHKYNDDNNNHYIDDENKINVVFTMDDGWESQYDEGYSILSKYGYRGSIGVIPSRVNSKNYMTYEQIGKLHKDGWNIINHSYSHKNNYENSEVEFKDVEKANKWLNNKLIGDCSEFYIVPYGSVSKEVVSKLAENGYKNIRTLNEVMDINGNKKEPYKLINLTTELEVEYIKQEIDRCVEEGVNIVFISHKFEEKDDNTGMYFSPIKFEQVVKYINDNSEDIEVMTYSEAFTNN